MFGRLLRAVPNLRGASDLTSYVNNLHSMNGSAAPTRDEATRDYAAAKRAAMLWGRSYGSIHSTTWS